MRLFVALNPDRETRDWIASEQLQIRHQLSMHSRELRWTAPESLHITLVFLGEIADPEPVIAALESCPARSLELELGGLGVFPSPRHPTVLWLGCVDLAAVALTSFQSAVADTMRPFVEPERRAYAPHLTLARAKPEPRSWLGATVQNLTHVPRCAWRLDSYVLMCSKTTAAGAQYEVLREF